MTTTLNVPGAKDDSRKATYRLLAEDFPFALSEFMHNLPWPVSPPGLLHFLTMTTGTRSTVKETAKTVLAYFTFCHTPLISADSHVLKASALAGMADVAGYGARKYTASGWKDVPDGVVRYTEAMYRHCFSLLGGEVSDPESGFPHRSHILWNCVAMLELAYRENKLDELRLY